jgi:hypothetical protein
VVAHAVFKADAPPVHPSLAHLDSPPRISLTSRKGGIHKIGAKRVALPGLPQRKLTQVPF